MKCVLSDEIHVDRFAVFADTAWLERRPELGALCRAARDAERRISSVVVQAVLPGVSEAGAKNVVAWCRSLALCDAAGKLTALADEVADSDDAPVPEQGVYDLWLVTHPLLGSRALHADRLSSTRDVRFESIGPMPAPPTKDVVFRSCVDVAKRFIVRAMLPEGAAPSGHPRETKARCRVRWSIDFDTGHGHFALDGALDGDRGANRLIHHQPEPDGVDLAEVLRAWARGPLAAFGRWHPAQRRLAVRFDGLTTAEQEAFQKNLLLPEVEVVGRGVWKNVTLEGVPIGPATPTDATRWAMARLDRRLRQDRRYRTHADVRALFDSLAKGTPLESHSPALAQHDELLGQYATTPDVFWSLAAPADLHPDTTDPRTEAAQ